MFKEALSHRAQRFYRRKKRVGIVASVAAEEGS